MEAFFFSFLRFLIFFHCFCFSNFSILFFRILLIFLLSFLICFFSFFDFDVFFSYLHSGRSKVTRGTVGRHIQQPTKVFEFVKLILRPLRSQSESLAEELQRTSHRSRHSLARSHGDRRWTMVGPRSLNQSLLLGSLVPFLAVSFSSPV